MDTPHASPLRTPGPVRTRMLDLLAERALMPLDQIEALRDRINEPLERILIDEQSVLPSLMQALLAEITGIPAARTPLHVNEPYLTAIPIRAVLDYQVIPIESEDNDVITLVADQIQTVNTEDDLRLMIGRSIRWNWCAPEVLRKSIQHYYGIG
ncbi:MAG: hypothetical protein ACI97B_001432, partial [Verrucomicrobiales bacterium]